MLSKTTRKGILRIETQWRGTETIKILSIQYFIGNRSIELKRHAVGTMSFSQTIPMKDMVKARNELDRARTAGEPYANDFLMD